MEDSPVRSSSSSDPAVEGLECKLIKTRLEEEGLEENNNSIEPNVTQGQVVVSQVGQVDVVPMNSVGEEDSDEDDDNSVDLEEQSSLDKALQIDLILLQIQNNLHDLRHLLNFRKVNKLWFSIVSPSTMKKYCQELQFVYKTTRDAFHQVGHPGMTLDRFNESFRKCCNFPFTSCYLDEGTLSSRDVKEFISMYGQHVKKLRLRIRLSDDDSIVTTIGNFRSLLIYGAPNVNHLTIEGTSSQWDLDLNTIFPSPQRLVQLPKLKNITFGDESTCSAIIKEVVNVAPNLENIYGVATPNLWVLMNDAPHQMNKIKGLFIGHMYTRYLDLYRKVANLKLKLEDLGIHYLDAFQDLEQDEREIIGTIIAEIMESSQNSLEKISFSPLAFVSTIKFPILSKVKEINIRDCAEFRKDVENQRIFPIGQRMSRIFPNVNKVEFEMKIFQCDFKTWMDSFQYRDSMSSVKTLSFCDAKGRLSYWLKQFASYFPSVNHFQIHTYDVEELPDILTSIFKYFDDITTLKIRARVESYDGDFCDQMESTMSGIPQGKCASLRKKYPHSISDINTFRSQPSILDLKNLSLLSMEFDLRFINWVDNVKNTPIFSTLTRDTFLILKERQDLVIKVFNSDPSQSDKVDGLKLAMKSVLDCVDHFKWSIDD